MRIVDQDEATDMILRYLIDNKGELPIHSSIIAKQVFPDSEPELTYVLMKRLLHTVDSIVTAHIRSEELHKFEVFFESSAITKSFLEVQGGFTAIGKAKKAELAIQNTDREMERAIRIDTLRLNKLNKLFLIINAVLAIGTLLWTIFGGKD